LAERFGTTEQTVYKWRHRDSVHDRSHTPHRLQTALTPAQEAVVAVLRRTLLVSINDLLAVECPERGPVGVKYLPQMADEASRR